MKHQYVVARLFSIFAFFFLVLGCGYLENDNIDFQETVAGNIKIQKQANTKTYSLVLAESDESYAVLIENCSSVYYDLLNNAIFGETRINQTISTFYKIDVMDSISNNLLTAIKKKRITKQDFDIAAGKKLRKWQFPDVSIE